jgi:hypothetical protein
VPRIQLELWRQRTDCCIGNAPPHTSFFTMEFSTKNKITVVPYPPYSSLFLRLQIKLKGRRFYTVQEIETESQGGEHPHRTRLPGCIEKIAEALRTVHTCGRGLLRVWWWPIGPKLVSDQKAAPVPEIMDCSLYISWHDSYHIKHRALRCRFYVYLY